MTHRIQKSKIAALGIQDFAAAVDRHIVELESFAEHRRLVDEGKAEPYPPPDPNPEIDAAVRRDGDKFVADFEIVDDTEVRIAQDLRAAKVLLLTTVSNLERVAADGVLPEGKRRLFTLKQQEIVRTKDAAKNLAQARATRAKLPASGPDDPAIDHADTFISNAEQVLDAVLEARGITYTQDQIDADDAFLAEFDDISAKMRRIERHGAELHAAIEDLPDMTTLAAWSPTPFP